MVGNAYKIEHKQQKRTNLFYFYGKFKPMPSTYPSAAPVIFTAFANPRGDLPNLTQELNGIQDVLQDLERQGKIKKHLTRTDTDLNAYFDFLRSWKNEVSIFHYGGHANSEGLTLQNAHTFFEPLAKELVERNPDSLVLVFLNGCSTRQHVDTLFALGVKAVIATSVSIADDLATRFAVRFYQNLAKQDALETAYTSAANYAKGNRSDTQLRHFGTVLRGLALPGTSEESATNFPWALYVQDEAVLRHCFFEDQARRQSPPPNPSTYHFNERLSKALIEQMRQCNPVIQNFWERASSIPHWESQELISAKAKEIIAYSTVGVIGIQLSKLMAIGQEAYTEGKPKKYVQKCLDIANYSLDLLNFALISSLWDAQKQGKFPLDLACQLVLEKRLKTATDPSLPEQLQLLQTLVRAFTSTLPAEAWPIPELFDQLEKLPTGSPIEQSIQTLQALHEQEKNSPFTLADCSLAEEQLIVFFQHFAFLAAYQMASIKNIGYRQIRNDEPRYIHRYHALGLDSKANRDAEKINYTVDTAYSDAVLLYRGEDYRTGISLFPFVLDYHALTFEQGSKICFFQNKDIIGEELYYVFLEDNELQKIEHKGLLRQDSNYNELLLQLENRKQLNLDSVVTQFQQAREALLA